MKNKFLSILVLTIGLMSFVRADKDVKVLQCPENNISRNGSGSSDWSIVPESDSHGMIRSEKIKLAGGDKTGPNDSTLNAAIFRDPPAQYRGHAMWGFNLSSKVTENRIISEINAMNTHHFGGFFIYASGGSSKNLDEDYVRQSVPFFELTKEGIEYLSDEHLKLYKLSVDEAKKNGLEVILYDDYQYPTGTVAGQMYMKHPDLMAKRLDMVEKDVVGPKKAAVSIPNGIYVGAVLMNMNTFERIDISDKRTNDKNVQCDVPKGNWKVMVFYLNTDAVLKIRNPGYVDYLDEQAMDTFLSMSYEKFYAHLKEYFGSVIKMAFYDEPSMHWLNGRMWTPGFNKKFNVKYGYSPMKYYPALWYDIGPETTAARNALYGFRSQLFADTFVKKINQWCNDHGIHLTGHMDQEEVPNPIPITGDLMKVFEHQDIPGVDDIFIFGRSNLGYKVVTSSAFNYDKPVTMAETYAAYETINEKNVFQVAMDQYAMGVNFQVPDCSMQRVKNIVDLNQYTGRLSYMLQHGRHVADVAVLYPISSLQASYKFSADPTPQEWTPEPTSGDLVKRQGPAWLYAYSGGTPHPEIDYMDIGEILFRGLRVDYTYLHPEVLESRCVVDKKKLILNNKENREEYSVLIVPGGSTLTTATAQKIRAFYRSGGCIIATSRLPYLSAEFGHNKDVQQAMSEVFGIPVDALVKGDVKLAKDKGYGFNSNKAGGKSFFLPKAEHELIDVVLKQVLPVRDVDIRETMWPLKTGRDYDGALTYIHKVKNGRDIYFFANSSEKQVDTKVILRGKKGLNIWNPHTGTTEEVQTMQAKVGASDVTEVHLVLPPVSSLFYVTASGAQVGR